VFNSVGSHTLIYGNTCRNWETGKCLMSSWFACPNCQFKSGH